MQTTPDSKSQRKSQFSPVIVAESPVKKILQSGNLTGNTRRVRDLAAELYNFIQDWNAQHLLGVQSLNNILDLKLSALIDCEIDKEQTNVYPENLQEHCEQLDGIVRNMDEIVSKLQTVAQQMHSVENLEKLQNINKAPLFLTWPVSRYSQVMDEICSAYRNELKTRIIVKESIAHSSTKEELSYYVITWVHEPYIDSQVEFLLESLLQETGHR